MSPDKRKRREALNANARRWRANNPEKAKNSYYRYQYGITLEQYNQMLLTQGNVCAICRKGESVLGRSLCVDHDHKTGKPRGLLCLDCNSGIGHLKDDTSYLLRAIKYLNNN